MICELFMYTLCIHLHLSKKKTFFSKQIGTSPKRCVKVDSDIAELQKLIVIVYPLGNDTIRCKSKSKFTF